MKLVISVYVQSTTTMCCLYTNHCSVELSSMSLCVCAELRGAMLSESAVEDSSTTAADVSDNLCEADIVQRLSQLVEPLASVSSVVELLSQAAQTSLHERERQVEPVTPALNL